jgi:hypothetical protein
MTSLKFSSTALGNLWDTTAVVISRRGEVKEAEETEEDEELAAGTPV